MHCFDVPAHAAAPEVVAAPAPAATAGVRGALARGAARVLQHGVDPETPAHLVDRVVYANWVYAIATLANVAGALANAHKGYPLLLALNGLYQVAIGVSAWLTARRRYLAARVTFLATVCGGFVLACAVQGPQAQIEHFFLAIGVLAYGMFHPSERRFGVAFVAACALAYLVFVNLPGPLLAIDPARGRYDHQDLVMNQLTYVAVLVLSLIGIANAYARATQLIDEQRAKVFEHNRLSALGSMACNVAHEINTPLMAMDLHLEDLELIVGDDPARISERQAVRRVAELSRRIATIVRGFKLVSYAGADDAPADTTLGAVVHAAVDLAAGRTRPLGVALEVELPDPAVPLRCRIVAVSQILLNLIDNAVDAVSELPGGERWVRLAVTVDGGVVTVACTDAGRIVDPATRHRLFEAFYTTKPLGKGTGLGLSISRQTAERHGGRLWFDDRSEHTRFVLELPLAGPAAPVAGAPSFTPGRG